MQASVLDVLALLLASGAGPAVCAEDSVHMALWLLEVSTEQCWVSDDGSGAVQNFTSGLLPSECTAF